MHIKIYRKVPKQGVNAEGEPFKIELGKHWEIFISRSFAEHLYPWNIKQFLFKDRDFIKHIKEGEILPFWYGYAYYSFDCDMATYMPVPLNFIVAALRWLRHKWFGFKQIPRKFNSTQEAYSRGYHTGYEEGYEEGFNEASSK